MKEIEGKKKFFKEKLWKYNTCCKRARGTCCTFFRCFYEVDTYLANVMQ